MPNARGFASIVAVLLLSQPVARGKEVSDQATRNEIRRQLIGLQQARRAALIAQAEFERARRENFPDQPIATVPADPFEADGPGGRPMAQPSSHLETIDAQMRAAWGKVLEVQVFGRIIGDASVMVHLARLIEARTDEATRAHDLAPRETEKLRLAAHGDVRRYLDRYREVQYRYEEAARRSALRAGSADELASLQQGGLQGPFGEGSLFAKVLAKILADREAVGGEKP